MSFSKPPPIGTGKRKSGWKRMEGGADMQTEASACTAVKAVQPIRFAPRRHPIRIRRKNKYLDREYTALPRHPSGLLEILDKDFPGVVVQLSTPAALDAVVYLDLIAVLDREDRGRGIGSRVMILLCQWADEHRIVLALDPGIGNTVNRATGRSRSLAAWYAAFGFEWNRGREEIEAMMYRMPDRRSAP